MDPSLADGTASIINCDNNNSSSVAVVKHRAMLPMTSALCQTPSH